MTLKQFIMNKLLKIAFVATALVALGASAQTKKIEAAGSYKSKTVEVGAFRKITVNGNIRVNYTPNDAKASIKFVAPQNIVDLVEIKVKDANLTIGYKDGYSVEMKNDSVVVDMSAPIVSEMALNGSGDIRMKGKVKTSNFTSALNGSGDMVFGDIDVEVLSVTLNGSGDVNIGNVKSSNCDMSLNGSGDVNAKSVAVAAFNLSLNGSGDMNVWKVTTTNSILSLNGSGDMKVDGCKCAALVANLNGSGDMDVDKIDATNLTADLKGSGSMALSGGAVAGVYNVRNSGTIDAAELIAGIVTAKVNGSGEILCNASKSLNSEVKGSGVVSYKGDARNVNGKGKLRKIK